MELSLNDGDFHSIATAEPNSAKGKQEHGPFICLQPVFLIFGVMVKRRKHKKIKPSFFRKTKFLAGSNIYITEDFSKRVKDKRTELQKFMRKMKKR